MLINLFNLFMCFGTLYFQKYRFNFIRYGSSHKSNHICKMIQHGHAYSICCRSEVAGYIILGCNIKAAQGYVAVNFEVASCTSFLYIRHLLLQSGIDQKRSLDWSICKYQNSLSSVDNFKFLQAKSRRFLKQFSVSASTTKSGNLFHLFTTRPAKWLNLREVLKRLFWSLKEWPLKIGPELTSRVWRGSELTL